MGTRIMYWRVGRRKGAQVTFKYCDLCGEGVGVTKYPGEDFKHSISELVPYLDPKYGSKELCSSCLSWLLRHREDGTIEWEWQNPLLVRRPQKNIGRPRGAIYSR